MTEKKYVSPRRLDVFLENIKTIFSPIVHTHTLSELTDYEVDFSLSPTSSNPIANKVVDAEFEAISQAMLIFEQEIGKKADASTLSDYSTTEESQSYTDDAVAQKSLVQIITWGADD